MSDSALVHSAASGFIPTEFADGSSFTVGYPFVRETYWAHDDEGRGYERPTWRPGVRYEDCGPEDVVAVADGEGSVTFNVVATFKPGRYPTRVFLTRSFTTPQGHVFGKGKLHIWTLEKLRRLTRGYLNPYRLDEDLTPSTAGTERSEVSPNQQVTA